MKYPVVEVVKADLPDGTSYLIEGDKLVYGIEVRVDHDPNFPEPTIEIFNSEDEDEEGEGITLSLAQAHVLASLLSTLVKENVSHV